MTQNETAPKKKFRAGIVFLVILLILAGATGYVYYSICKAPIALDDPQAMAASAPMSAGERFRFSANDQTAQVKIDTADFWNLILPYAGDDFLDTINEEVSGYGLSVSGCGIQLDQNGLQLNLELYYKENRLVAKVPCDLEMTGKHISLTPSGVKLGVISLPVGNLLSGVKLEYDLDLPVISEVTQVGFEEGALLLTGPVEADIRALVPVDQKLYQTAVFDDSRQPLADALQREDGMASILSYLEQEPAAVEALYRDLFTLADPEITEAYLSGRHGITERFFPGIDFSAIGQEQELFAQTLTEENLVLEKYFNLLVNIYNDKKFTLSGGEFLQKKEPFQALKYSDGKYDSLFEKLDPESFFLILVGAEDGFIRNTSSFYRMCSEDQEFTQEVDFDRTYILGCVFRSVDGDPFLIYESMVKQSNNYSRRIKLHPLTEEEVSALQVPGKFGVWTG